MKNKSVKLTVKIILLLIIIPAAAYLFLTCLDNNKETINYKEESSIDYKVCLKEKENIPFEEKCQPKGRSYPANYIDYIDINFDYTYLMDKIVDYEYEYYIEGIIIITEKGSPNKVIDERSPITLLEKTKKTANKTRVYDIPTTNLKINYDEYNDIVKSYKYEVPVAMDSKLKIILHIDTTSKYESFDASVKTTNQIEMIIPLTESTMEINMNYENVNSSKDVTKETDGLNIDYIRLGGAVLLSIVGLCVIISIIAKRAKKISAMSEYDKFISHVLKNYDRWIITAEPTEENKLWEDEYEKTIDVTEFQELVDKANRSGGTILFTEDKDQSGKKVAWFTIEDEKRLYRKIYTDEDDSFK